VSCDVMKLTNSSFKDKFSQNSLKCTLFQAAPVISYLYEWIKLNSNNACTKNNIECWKLNRSALRCYQRLWLGSGRHIISKYLLIGLINFTRRPSLVFVGWNGNECKFERLSLEIDKPISRLCSLFPRCIWTITHR
jgi:hypothetical protein